MENVDTNNFSDKKIQLKLIQTATDYFNDENNLIREGGFGKVYRGNLVWSGERIDIAARKLHYDYGQGEMEFWHEISMLAGLKNRLKHENLVSFIGYCDEGGVKIIIYKLEANGSLDEYLDNPTKLGWMQRLQICVDVARALNHIHYHDEYDSSVIHGNIKSSKILLDGNWKPKLSGFEHSKSNTRARRHRLVLAEVVGTLGYVDPTYEKTGFVTHKSDVYSFGVVLLEVLCGKKAFILDDKDEGSVQFFEIEKLDANSSEPNLNQQEEMQSYLVETSDVPSFTDVQSERTAYTGQQPYPPKQKPPSVLSEWQPFLPKQKPPTYLSELQPFLNSAKSTSRPPSGCEYQEWKPPSLSELTELKPPSIGELSQQKPQFSEQPSSSSFTQVEPFEEQRFKLKSHFTMKRLDRYSHSPNEVLLAQLARSYNNEGKNLEDLINPDLRKQIDPQSLEVFTEIIYNCLKEQRAQRHNIDQILKNLEIALKYQMRRDFPEQSIVAGEVEGTSSNLWKEENLKRSIKIPLSDIELATENFTKGFLGSGGFAKVYGAELDLLVEDKNKGEFSKKRMTVAIKCIRKDKRGEEGFFSEIELLTRCRHDNVVTLLGFCNEGPDLILVYEHAPNGSLDDYLTNFNDLTWAQRLKICIDVAKGLNHLHTTKVEDEQTIIHRDIKSGNILLGKNFVAKIADFGLSRFVPASQQEKTHISKNVAGTEVYMCPEYRKEGKLKKAVDIYSFGVVLFEIFSGKLAYDQAYNPYGIAHVARQRYKEGTLNEMVDRKLMEEVNEVTSIIGRGPNQDSLETFKKIAHQCVTETQEGRPTAEEIIVELKKALLFQEKNKHNLQMSLEEVKLATQNFSQKNFITGGGFGDIFRGEITHANGHNSIVAKRWVKDRHQGENEFLTELEILFEYKHENIISLLGYCNEKNEKIIVYDYASHGSLDEHLGDVSFSWIKRLQICIDVVRGLAFLHGGFITEEIVIHRDLKCANILLDAAWKAKISDFGLSLITTVNQQNIRYVAGTIGYVDPEYKNWGYLTKESDIYSLGVILFEMLYGKLVAPNVKDYKEEDVITLLKKIREEGKRDSIVFEGIKEQIAPESLSIFQNIIGLCLDDSRKKRPTSEVVDSRRKRPTADDVLKHLNKALEVQEAYEISTPKLPKYYEELIKMSISRRKFLSEKKKALYNMFSPGVLLPKEKVWFSLGANGERNEMISAEKFSYKNRQLLKWRSISESRFQKLAKMFDISNLMIQIRIKTRFLAPDVMYGVYLVFKFYDLKTLPSTPMYVNLAYQMESKTLHTYFATLRKDKWMMIELYRFLNQKEDNDFEVLLQSFSRYYCGSDVIYVEGIEFRPMDVVKIEENEQAKDVQTVMEFNSNIEFMQQFLTDNEDIIKRLGASLCNSSKEELALHLFNWIPIDEGEKLFSLSKVNGKKCHMLQAKTILHDSSNVKFFTLEPSAPSRFQEVGELLSQHVFRVKCKIESQFLSSSTKYVCFLVFKLSEKCCGLHCPVKVRNLRNRKDKEIKILYFRSPTPLNLHDGMWVPEQRQDGWMEVRVWEFNTNFEQKDGHVPMDLRLISYEGTMRGLVIYGLEFRPM